MANVRRRAALPAGQGFVRSVELLRDEVPSFDAVAAGFNAEGGSKQFHFSTRRTESELPKHLRLARGARRERDAFFLRAEPFFNAATYLENTDPDLLQAYGGKSLHEQSHGQSFLALVQHRFRGDGLYLLDEPEAALSPNRQLSLLKLMSSSSRAQARR
jgi:predicted ATPase